MTEASLDSWKNIAAQYAQNADYWRARAERAEAEVTYLQSVEAADAMLREWRERAERAEAELRLSDLALASSEGWRDKYEAALARVRALCDRHADWGWRSAYVRDIRAAIEGP